MVTKQFEQILESLKLDEFQIKTIKDYMRISKARINPDMIEYSDGSTYYSESYLSEMMRREREHGKKEGQQAPVIHIAQLEKCTFCNPD